MPKSSVDPYVQEQVAQTNGMLYRPLVGKLTRYPIPDLRLPSVSANEGRTFLDIGCNWGRWCMATDAKGYLPAGIDPRPEALDAARRVAKDLGVRARFVTGISEAVPFEDASFDVVFSYSVLQHLAKERVYRTVAEIRRVLKPGGVALVQMPNWLGVRCIYHQTRRRFREAVGFEVRYWGIRELHDAFNPIGPAEISVDGFFGLGIQAADIDLMPPFEAVVIRSSEALRSVSRRMPSLIYVADSVYLTMRSQAEPANRAISG
jgi:SAM-dependent methyltransferase